MKLFLVRHAWAGEHGDPRYPDDRLRPLTKEGAGRFESVVQKLSKRGFEPQLIVTSPLLRCVQTAEIIAAQSKHSKLVQRDELAPGSDLESLLQWCSAQPAEVLAWVGHAPDVGYLASGLIGDGRAAIRFAKGAVCAIDFDQELAIGQGELQWLATARLLGV